MALGGTLVQHLPDAETSHRHTPGTFGDHEVRLEPGSLARGPWAPSDWSVQVAPPPGRRRAGRGLDVTGWSEPDGVVEAIELPGSAFALGVLWHPEEDTQSRWSRRSSTRPAEVGRP